MSAPAIIPVTYAYSQVVYPTEGDGYVNGKTRHWLATDNVPFWQAGGDEVEEVAVLSFSDGASFSLIRHGDALFRPVFVPGTHQPCDLQAFEEACKGEVPWLDNPFRDAERTDTNRAPEPHVEGAEPPNPTPWRKIGESRRDACEAKIVAVASRMLVVDGIMHVPCEQPVLVLKSPATMPFGKPEALRLEWSMRGLESDDHPETGPTTVSLLDDRNGRLRSSSRPVAVSAIGPRIRWKNRPWRCFGLDETLQATLFGRDYADASGTAFKADPNLVSVLRPWLLAPPLAQPLERYAADAFDQVGNELRKLSRASATGWYDARDAKESGNMQGVLDALDGILDRPADRALMTWEARSSLTDASRSTYSDRDSADAMAELLRYRLVERGRTAVAVIAEEDDAALSEIWDSGDPDALSATGSGPSPM